MLVKLSIKCWLKLIPSCVATLPTTLDIERLYHLFNINSKLLVSFLIAVIKLEISFALVWKPFCTSPLLGSGFSTGIRCIWVIARQIISVIRGNWLSSFPRFPLAFHRACLLDSTDVIITTWTFISRWNLCGKITSSRATMGIYWCGDFSLFSTSQGFWLLSRLYRITGSMAWPGWNVWWGFWWCSTRLRCNDNLKTLLTVGICPVLRSFRRLMGSWWFIIGAEMDLFLMTAREW